MMVAIESFKVYVSHIRFFLLESDGIGEVNEGVHELAL